MIKSCYFPLPIYTCSIPGYSIHFCFFSSNVSLGYFDGIIPSPKMSTLPHPSALLQSADQFLPLPIYMYIPVYSIHLLIFSNVSLGYFDGFIPSPRCQPFPTLLLYYSLQTKFLHRCRWVAMRYFYAPCFSPSPQILPQRGKPIPRWYHGLRELYSPLGTVPWQLRHVRYGPVGDGYHPLA